MFRNRGDRNHLYHLETGLWYGQNDRSSAAVGLLIWHNKVLISSPTFRAQHRKFCVLRLQLPIPVSCRSSVDISSTLVLVYKCSNEYTIKCDVCVLMHNL